MGALLAIVSWNVVFGFPRPSLDASWEYAIYAAAHRGLHFGTDIVFTYGPLGFLNKPTLWYGDLAALAFVYQAALHILLCVTLVYSLRRQIGLIAAALVGFVVVVIAPSTDVPAVLAAAWCLAALSHDPPPFALWLVTIGGAVLGAAETLVEARPGPVIVAICVITLLIRERSRRHLGIFFGCLLVFGAALWFASGQTLANAPDFVSNELQILTGYSEAMGVPANGRIWLALPIALVLVAGAVAILAPVRRLQLGAGLVVGLVCFSLFKEGFVRADSGHTPIFFGSVLALVAASSLLRDRRSLAVLTVLAGLVAINLALRPRPPLSTFDPVQRVNQAYIQLHTLTSPRHRDVIEVFAAAFMAADYRLPASAIKLLRGHTVHLDPWDTAAAWAYHLDWDPAPVFQGYSAYTSSLDRLNARALSASRGPQRILRENTRVVDIYHETAAIDGRLGVWDPPGEALAMMCNYEPQLTTGSWQVLARVSDRCGAPHLVSSISAPPGQTVTIPAAGNGQAIFARVHGMAVSGIEKVQTLLFRANVRHALINATERVRIVPGTAEDGLLFDLAPKSDFPAPFALSPHVRTISFTGTSGPYRVDVYRMSVTPIGKAPG